MLEQILISSYLAASSWIYGYFIIRRAFWVVRLVDPKHRIKISLLFGLPLVLPFAFLLWIVSPLYLLTIFVFCMFMYSYYIQTHPRLLMRQLLKYIGIKELFEQEPNKEQVRTVILKQRLMRSIELQQDLIDKITEEIKIMREMIKSTEKQLEKPSEQTIPISNNNELKNKEVKEKQAKPLLTDKDLEIIQTKISKLKKKYQV